MHDGLLRLCCIRNHILGSHITHNQRFDWKGRSLSANVKSNLVYILHVTFSVHVDTCVVLFLVWLTVHPGMILVNNQTDVQFFMYVYFYSLHVSGSHVPIIRRIIVSMRHSV